MIRNTFQTPEIDKNVFSWSILGIFFITQNSAFISYKDFLFIVDIVILILLTTTLS